MGRRMTAVKDTGPAREDLVDFLRSAPPQLQAWAREEIAALDGNPDVGQDQDQDGGGVDDEFDDGPDDEFDDEEDSGPVPRHEPARDRRHTGRRLPTRWLRSKPVLALAGLALVATVVGGVYLAGRSEVPGIQGAATDTASGTGQVDQAKLAALMQKISANPKDVASLSQLGDLYFAAGDYKTAAVWEQKVLQVDPKNVTAMLALGAGHFNQGDTTKAEQVWQQVVALDPRQAEAHYDLGFLYLSKNPPDMAKVREEWGKVVQIDPNSQIAKTVTTHLTSLQTASPGASASPSVNPSVNPSANASANASVNPSASAGK